MILWSNIELPEYMFNLFFKFHLGLHRNSVSLDALSEWGRDI